MTEKNRGTGVVRWLVLLARICVVVSLYYVISRKVDFENVQRLLTPGFALALTGAVLLTISQAVACTLRWVVLAGGAIRLPPLPVNIAIYFEGLFFNQALPSFVGGDTLRVLRWRGFGVATHDAFVSVVRDRMFGAIGAALFALLGCWQLWYLPVESYKTVVAALLGLAALGTGVCLLAVIQSRRITKLFIRLPRIHSRLHRISAAPLGARTYLKATAYTILGQSLSGISVLWIADSIGVELPAFLLVTITGIIVVMSMIPISLAGWGVREAGFVALLGPLGVDSETAVLLGISFGLASLISALLGGLSLLVGFGSGSFRLSWKSLSGVSARVRRSGSTRRS